MMYTGQGKGKGACFIQRISGTEIIYEGMTEVMRA